MDQYPVEMFPIPEVNKKRVVTVDYHRTYSLPSLIIIFFLFSFLGWCWEVGYNFFNNGFWANRGFFFGPYLPIYGSGSVLILVLLKKWLDKPIIVFFLIMLICGTIEYGTGLYLELVYAIKWWDYSGYLLNLNGRICLEGMLFFALGGCFFIYVAAPRVDEVLKKIRRTWLVILCLLLISFYTLDFCYSTIHPNKGQGITETEIVRDNKPE